MTVFPTGYSDKGSADATDKVWSSDGVTNFNLTVDEIGTEVFTDRDTDDLTEGTTNKYASTTNVNAAGATMNADTTMAGNGYFLDDDTMAGDDATKVASQQSIKAYVDAKGTDINGLTEESGITDGDELMYYNGASNVKVDYTDLSTAIRGDIPTVVIKQTTRAYDAASGTVSIAHGLGVTPKSVQVIGYASLSGTAGNSATSNGFSDGTINMCSGITAVDGGSSVDFNGFNDASNVIRYGSGSSAASALQTATINLDSTNVDIVWTYNSLAGTSSTMNITLAIYA